MKAAAVNWSSVPPEPISLQSRAKKKKNATVNTMKSTLEVMTSRPPGLPVLYGSIFDESGNILQTSFLEEGIRRRSKNVSPPPTEPTNPTEICSRLRVDIPHLGLTNFLRADLMNSDVRAFVVHDLILLKKPIGSMMTET